MVKAKAKLKLKKALLSVSNKTGITDFAKQLSALGVDIISTGGTAALLNHDDNGRVSFILFQE